MAVQYGYAGQPAQVVPSTFYGVPKTMTTGEFASKSYDTRTDYEKPAQRFWVVAVAGTTPNNNADAPNADGWFLSDFYLFRHLLSPLRRNIGSPTVPEWNQVWLTAVSPQDLVRKYNQFTQGRAADRRVVLDGSNVQAATAAVTVYDSDSLRQAFLDAVKKTCTLAKQNDVPVLIMMFGHGKAKRGSVLIGGTDNKHRVTIDDVRVAAGSYMERVTVYSTACYSGKWSKDIPFASAFITAAEAQQQSDSHTEDANGVAAGSVMSTALLETLIKTERYDTSGDNYGKLTYAAFTDVLRHTLQEIPGGQHSSCSFAARQDAWADHWWRQSTFSMLAIPQPTTPDVDSYQRQWQELTQLPLPLVLPQSVRVFAEMEDGAVVSSSPVSDDLRDLAKQYLASRPGKPNISGNQGPASLSLQAAAGQNMPQDQQVYLTKVLKYRLNDIVQLATQYTGNLGLSSTLPSCDNYDAFAYLPDHADDQVKSDRYKQLFDIVADRELFRDPDDDEGQQYAKGIAYLAAVVSEAKWTIDKAKQELGKLKKLP